MNPSIEVLSRVATGVTSRMDRACDHARGIELAVKRCAHSAAATLAREAQVLGAVTHAGIPALMEFGEDAEGAFLARAWVDGITVDERIAKHVLTEAECHMLMQALLSALAAVHAAGYAHADVSTTNVLLRADGRVALIDFGNATLLDASAKHLKGSVYHMAPELFDDAPPSARSDLYAVGVLAYVAMTGAFPFAGENAAQVIAAHHRTRPVPLGCRCAASSDFAQWVERMLARQPEDRPANAVMAMQELSVLQAHGRTST